MLIPFLLLLTPIAGAQQMNQRHNATDTGSTTDTIESTYQTKWKGDKAAARRQRLYGALSIALFAIRVYLTIANVFAQSSQNRHRHHHHPNPCLTAKEEQQMCP